MADKIRQAVFSSLASLGVEADRVLDLYAGTGSIGIEALSRGVSWVDFVEQQALACSVIAVNLRHTRLEHQAAIHQTAVDRYLRRTCDPYDLVFLDPPYADPGIPETLERLGASALVQSGTIVVIGHWPRLSLPERIGSLERIKERCHGDSCFSIFEVVNDAPERFAMPEAKDSDKYAE